MARTTATEVKQIMDDLTASDPVIDAYITAANTLVTFVLGSDTAIGNTLRGEVEKWFTAHMIACTIHRTTETERLGDASVKYTGQFRENLSSTPYGQMVMQLDPTGKMGNIGKKGASMFAVTSFD